MKKNTLQFCILWVIFSLLPTQKLSAQDNISYELDDYIVYYNVFNSSLIPPKVARIHKLNRANNRVYLNVALVKKSGGYGIAPTALSGQYRNLMQQKFALEFIEIKEPTATYYLAPIRFDNEEILHLDITVQPDTETPATTFTITKKLYVD